MKSKITGDSGSFVYILKGIAFLNKNRQLLKFSVIQILISIIVFISSFIGVYFVEKKYFIQYFSQWLTDSWYMITLYYLLFWLIYIIGVIITYFTSIIIANILNSPFNAVLSEKTEEIYTGKKIPKDKRIVRSMVEGIVYEITKAVFFLSLYIVLLPLLFLPLFGITQLVYTIAMGFATALILSFDFLDYPMERDHLKFKKRLHILKKRPGIVLGFGGSSFFIMTVPVVNFFIIPVLVISGTILYIDKLKDFNAVKNVIEKKDH